MFLLCLIYCCCLAVTNNDSCNSNNKRSVSVLTWFCMCKFVSVKTVSRSIWLCVCLLLFYDHTVGKEGFLIIDIRVLI